MRKEPYQFPQDEFFSRDHFNKIKKFSRGKETPFLIVDLEEIKKSYDYLIEHMPFAKIQF